MLAIDTNLVVRYLTNDHPKQSPRARTLIDGEAVFVSVCEELLEAGREEDSKLVAYVLDMIAEW